MRGILTVATFAACLSAPALAFAQEAPAPAVEAQSQPDPWEGFNRDLFAVHEGVDQAVVEPIARGYRAVTPRPVRTGVRNFLRNLRGPVIFANDVLQGEFERAGTTAGRFALNSTIGIAGVFDPANSMGLEYHDEDFGQTLAVWGLEPGPYIFVPLMGPTNVRDTAGRVVDTVFDPLTWAEFDEADEVRIGRTVLTALNARESVIDAVDDVRRNALDPYVSIRTSYALLRESAIQNGESSVEDLPEFEAIDDAEATTDTPDNFSVTEDNSQHFDPNQPEPMSDALAEDFPAPMSGGL